MKPKMKIKLGTGKTGLTYNSEIGCVIINTIETNELFKTGSNVDFSTPGKKFKLKQSFYICDNLNELIENVKSIKHSSQKVVNHGNFELDFSKVNDDGLKLFISICKAASKPQHVSLVI